MAYISPLPPGLYATVLSCRNVFGGSKRLKKLGRDRGRPTSWLTKFDTFFRHERDCAHCLGMLKSNGHPTVLQKCPYDSALMDTEKMVRSVGNKSWLLHKYNAPAPMQCLSRRFRTAQDFHRGTLTLFT
ncbi:hypothetical protein AVEN_175437-1 [Araneus ventricosus]|uniref:Uncharacterized protein n=1 Tax=Araneus ventricosus TaxID=182803 RepID=A0A4Y2K8S6_ARAVE|nr:hypothetical protein AVEN_272651-1 [Araneus ventricosus]GBM98840.1 hypothetical protein AVEN_59762-1 [Araneus ventricosus]GBM98870.1 hypothetical protein AVEN_175437-1 [Araneus ventricosus]